MKQPFRYVIGIVGHPTTPDVAWSAQQLQALQEIGVDTLQLSIAWSSRPAGEVLNLEDLDDAKNRETFNYRVTQARRFGFRTLGHFGLPVGPQQDTTACIMDPAVRQGYARRLRDFIQDFADDVMIYTYDQRAWLCSEYGVCPRCRGVPLHERLVPFLEEMTQAVRSAKAGARLWWEPWELSEGQILMCVEQIRPESFGLIMHHTLAEVYFVNTTDLSFRNVARLAARRGIPFIGEGFFGGSGEDVDPLTHLACPRLVYQQLDAFRAATGVVGIKEYYGFVPDHFSVNVAFFAAYLRSPEAGLAELLKSIAGAYGNAAEAPLLEAWEMTAEALEVFPWNASWALRTIFRSPQGKTWREVPRAHWPTPAWEANRRGFYMVTDNEEQHPWLREDVGLRALLAARRFQQAAKLLTEAEGKATAKREDVGCQRQDVERAASVATRFGEGLLRHRSDVG